MIAKTALKQFVYGLASVVVLGLGFTAEARAAAIIDNGTIQLGVDDFGQLNIPGPPSAVGTPSVGLRFLPTNNEATAAGCLCEGWGVADSISSVAAWANNNSGSANLILKSFSSTTDSATSIVANTTGIFEVTHKYIPDSRTPYLYRAEVTIKNTGSNAVDLRYRRVMDWDIEPTPFSEFSTIQGTAGASNVLFASNNGFAGSNPLEGSSSLGATGDFTDVGPFDHGALFDFGFGLLEAGKSFSFDIFYGAAPTETLALSALAAVGAEVYSFGQPAGGAESGEPNTFIFAFKGVGGSPVVPIPTPALLPGLIGLGLTVWRKRKGGTVQEQANG
nr:MAG: PTPA-CTERM sorting domain-containing protein [Leptolyngbya sp. IPPAS B-1204]